MSRFGSITTPATATMVFVQSSEADDLEILVNTKIAAIVAQDTPQSIASITLAGAGDGHTFVVAIESAPTTDVNGGFHNDSNIGCLCYQAADAEQLAIARSAVPTFTGQIADEQLAGASQGTQFMGMIVSGVVTAPT